MGQYGNLLGINYLGENVFEDRLNYLYFHRYLQGLTILF